MSGSVYAYDPELAPLAASVGGFDLRDVDEARASLAKLLAALGPPRDVDDMRWEDTVAQPGDVPVRVYRPDDAPSPRPAVLYLHGGGMVMGDLDSEHQAVAKLASVVGAVVVYVDYRLAPEWPYPAAVDDCWAALTWMTGRSHDLDIDAGRVAVVGQSAGGGLAASMALRARDRGGPAIAFQYLGGPMLDDRLASPSARAFTDTPIWDRHNAELAWGYYLAGCDGDVPIEAAPGRASVAELVGLPPAYVSAMQFDPMRDEAIAYATRLIEAGVAVELHSFPGTFHGSSMLPVEVSRRERREMGAVIRHALQERTIT